MRAFSFYYLTSNLGKLNHFTLPTSLLYPPHSGVGHITSDGDFFTSDGDFAGWECAFSTVSGERMSVPEDYIPEALREWEVGVWGFETLTSEKLLEGAKLYRKTARVFPEVGCGLDNLSVELSQSETPLEEGKNFKAWDEDGSYTLDQGTHTETCFHEGEWRHRLQLLLGPGCSALLGISIIRERRLGDFSDGSMYHGGGLDSQKLGRALQAKCFADDNASDDGDLDVDESGTWSWGSQGYQSAGLGVSNVGRPSGKGGPEAKFLALRGGYGIRTGPAAEILPGLDLAEGAWGLEVLRARGATKRAACCRVFEEGKLSAVVWGEEERIDH
ncbi:unnamed protein product [Chrysoparadoxa australica]